MRKLLLAFVLLWPSVGWAQNVMCPTRSTGDSTNACANTAFVGAGIVASFASPPPLGNITPNTGAFTTLSATSSVVTNPAATVSASITGNGASIVSTYAPESLVVSSQGNQNGIVGTVLQNGINGSGLPSGVTGSGILTNAGNTVFGTFGVSTCTVAGDCTNEFDANNNSTSDATNAWPPNLALGTGNVNPIALFLGAGSSTSKKALLGLGIGQAGGISTQFLSGEYMWANCCSAYGLFIDADATHSAFTSALIRNTGQGSNVHLILQTMGATVGGNNVLQVLDSSGASHLNITQSGNVSAARLAGNGSAPVLTGCGTGPTTSANATSVHGTVTEGTTATGCVATFASAFANPPDCVVSWQTQFPAAFTYSATASALTVTNTSGSNQKFTYVCMGM